MASKKPKNATVGERMVLARVRETLGPKTMTLGEFRTREVLKWCRAEAKAHDRAIARAVRKERERCVWWVLHYNKQSRATTPIKDGWNT